MIMDGISVIERRQFYFIAYNYIISATSQKPFKNKVL